MNHTPHNISLPSTIRAIFTEKKCSNFFNVSAKGTTVTIFATTTCTLRMTIATMIYYFC